MSSKSPSTLIRGATILTVDGEDRVLQGDVLIRDSRIAKIAPKIPARGVDHVVNAKGQILIPGFVQCHVHLCQTLFRGLADDVSLLDWLANRIWPLEAALEPEDLRASARIGIAELLLSGTTSILDMGTVRHTEVLFQEAKRMGLRYAGGKCIMDAGRGYPARLKQSTDVAMKESVELCERFHGTVQGRLRYAFAPRFVLSSSEESMRRSVSEARKCGALLHTHASENAEEVELVRERTGMGNVEYLHSIGFSGPDVFVAHGIWLSPSERRLLRESKTRIVHCPSANLKLASGIARVPELLKEQIHVALGADGAACNNSLDQFQEMRLAALLHKVRGGPTAVPAARALRLATADGAAALGLNDCGSIEEGKLADLVLLDLQKPHALPSTGDPASRVVYSARPSDVRSVWVDGKALVEEGELLPLKLPGIIREAEKAAVRVRDRALN
ncbi:MAG: 5'-deoxyadenosine deaminase [Myxococcota bacterium]